MATAEFKQEMARVNVDILGISKLKWTGMGEFNSDDHYIYYCGQESLRRNGVPWSCKESDTTKQLTHILFPVLKSPDEILYLTQLLCDIHRDHHLKK